MGEYKQERFHLDKLTTRKISKLAAGKFCICMKACVAKISRESGGKFNIPNLKIQNAEYLEFKMQEISLQTLKKSQTVVDNPK